MIPVALTTGPFTLEEARRHGLTKDHLLGASWRRLGGGLYALRAIADDPDVVLTASSRRLPMTAVFSGPTARFTVSQQLGFAEKIDAAGPVPDARSVASQVPFSEAEIRALVAYVASLGSGPAIPTPHPDRGNLAAGQQLFTEHCAGCHQIAAAGGYVQGAVAPPLRDATPVQIAEAVRIGPYLMPRFSSRQIPDSQLDSIIRYVVYTKHPDDRGGWAIGHVGPVPEGLVTWFIGIAALVATCLVIGRRLQS